jgi:hypothetical protein
LAFSGEAGDLRLTLAQIDPLAHHRYEQKSIHDHCALCLLLHRDK